MSRRQAESSPSTTRKHRLSAAGSFSLVVTNTNDRILAVHEISTWRRNIDFWETPDPCAPIKRMLVDSEPLTPLRTDEVPDFSVDAVYTWVNAADANWQELIRPYRHAETVDLDLYGQRDELRYSLRSLAVNAPWIRTIYIF